MHIQVTGALHVQAPCTIRDEYLLCALEVLKHTSAILVQMNKFMGQQN